MTDRQIALALLLQQLDIEPDTSSFPKRKELQKVVYLGQRVGVDLNYRYGWYVYGPYSPELTKDYYQLAELQKEDRASVLEEVGCYALSPDYIEKLKVIRPITEEYAEAGLEKKEDWVELLASYDFLRERSRMDHEATLGKLNEAKPHLVQYVDVAVEALRKANLLLEGDAYSQAPSLSPA